MQKVMNVFVMLLLVVSLAPIGLAQEDGTDEMKDDKDDDYRETSVEVNGDVKIRDRLRVEADGKVEHRMEMRDEVTGERIKVRTEARSDKAEERKEVRSEQQEKRAETKERMEARMDSAQDRIMKAKEKYAMARDRYTNARDKYADMRETVSETRDKIRECKNDDTNDCKEARIKLQQNVKPFLHNSADMVIEALNKVAAKIEESDMPDEQKEERLLEINARIAHLTEVSANVDGLSDNASTQEIAASAKEVKKAWLESKHTMKKHAGLAAHGKLKGAYVQLQQLEDRFAKAIAKLEERGADVSVAQEDFVSFQAKLEVARDLFEQARALYENVDADSDIDAVAKEANGLLREAHEALKEARALLRDLVKEIKAINGGSVEAEVEVETEVETETEVDADDTTNTVNADVETTTETEVQA